MRLFAPYRGKSWHVFIPLILTIAIVLIENVNAKSLSHSSHQTSSGRSETYESSAYKRKPPRKVIYCPKRPTRPTRPSYPIEPPRKPKKPKHPSEPRKPKHPSHPSEPSHPTRPSHPSEPRKPKHPSHPSEQIHPEPIHPSHGTLSGGKASEKDTNINRPSHSLTPTHQNLIKDVASGGSSSYPSSPGLSGSRPIHSSISPVTIKPVASYPTSNGLSGYGKQNPWASYPESNSLSGNGAYKPVTSKPVASYPTSNGLSGYGKQNPAASYPESNSLSGNGAYKPVTSKPVASYPTSNGLSGSRDSNPVPSYPISSGVSGNGALKPVVSHPTSNSNLSGTGSQKPGTTYPTSVTGLSGSGRLPPAPLQPVTSNPVSYPVLNGGLSGNKPSIIHHTVTSPPQQTYVINTHNSYREPQQIHHHHYVYSPPTVIHYSPSYGTPASYPVYTGQYIPPYVYEYRSSASKYRRLLAGLALYNLGSVTNSRSKHRYHKTYVPKPDEICMFGVQYKTGSHDEMAIDCRVITNFIWAEESNPRPGSTVDNQSTVTDLVQNQLFANGKLAVTVNQTVINFVPDEVMLSNGTLVPAEIANTLERTEGMPHPQILLPNGTIVDPVTDPKFNGIPVDVTPNMVCYVIRTTRHSSMRRSVPCGLLQTYAAQSLRKNSAIGITSSFVVVLFAIGIISL